ncbi:carboxymuconolactone decarboxylase family protein [Microvirga sp. Mcv34]|uniref:carboxymuconolactone decarboxylase family protein n=1 Tax=Microvirga sp. Mcv34 TaxID=2926016 RepID=UPI0021C59C2D|nr:alkylhydroperoxidase [Microvirga sp. Mcv34]
MFLQVIEEENATGKVAEIYEKQRAQLGFVMEAAKCFTARPDLLPIYTEFSDRIRAGFSLGLREWRLITLIAAKHIPSTYCSHVYSKQLADDLGSKEAVLAVQRDFRTAGLSDRDIAMLTYAEKVVRNASQITQGDIERLRQVDFSDQQICDIALCASFRCFVSRFFDAMGAGTEAAFVDENSEFQSAMSVGRPL